MTDTPTPDDVLGLKADDATAEEPKADTSLTGQPVPKVTEHKIGEVGLAGSGTAPTTATPVGGATTPPVGDETAQPTPTVDAAVSAPVEMPTASASVTPAKPAGDSGVKPMIEGEKLMNTGKPQPMPVTETATQPQVEPVRPEQPDVLLSPATADDQEPAE